nr:hypothetical protein [uncultured Flavobacterium sp.]
MKKYICIFLFLAANILSSQSTNDYFSLYKGGKKYLKPVKHLFFDASKSDNIKVEDKEYTYFQIKKQRFKFDIKKNTVNNCSSDILKKIKLENPAELEHNAYKFFKSKKEEAEKKNKIKLVYPPAGYQSYFKIYILEKINNKIIKYEVNWENSTF